MITNINESNFNELKSNDGSLKVLKIGAEWCTACKAIHPAIEAYSESENFKNVNFYDMDADQNTDFVLSLGIKSLPTFMFFKNGDELEVTKGLNHITLKSKIEELK